MIDEENEHFFNFFFLNLRYHLRTYF